MNPRAQAVAMIAQGLAALLPPNESLQLVANLCELLARLEAAPHQALPQDVARLRAAARAAAAAIREAMSSPVLVPDLQIVRGRS